MWGLPQEHRKSGFISMLKEREVPENPYSQGLWEDMEYDCARVFIKNTTQLQLEKKLN